MVCPNCNQPSLSDSARYCVSCGALLDVSASPWPVVAAVLRVVAPAIGLAATFLPWVTVGVVTRTRHWDAYRIGPLSWLWFGLGVLALIVAVAALRGVVPRWLQIAWMMLGGISLGVGTSGLVFIQVSARVSTILGAPNPLSLGYGMFVFAAASALWCAAAWVPWRPLSGAVPRVAKNSNRVPPV